MRQSFFGALFSISALLFWLIGRACHYVLGGDASALWERALLARARRSPEFRKFGGIAAMLVVGGIAWLIADGQRQEALRKQQYEQQRQAHEQKQDFLATAISAADLSFRDVVLSVERVDDNYWLSATITNNSKYTLASVTFLVTLEDCPPKDNSTAASSTANQQFFYDLPIGSSPTAMQCRIVGQTQDWFLTHIPPSQTRTLSDWPGPGGLRFKDLPDIDPKRPRVWTWKIVSIEAARGTGD